MKTDYESTMERIGHLRFKVRPYVTQALVRDFFNEFRTVTKALKIHKMSQFDGEAHLEALLCETFNYLHGNEFPLKYSQKEFCTDVHDYQILSKDLREKGDGIQNILWMQVLNHERGGKRVYDVSDELAKLLCHTDLRGLTAEHLNLPFPSIYINVPSCTDLKIITRRASSVKLNGVYITEEFNGVRITPDISVKFIDGKAVFSDGLTYEERQKFRCWCITAVGEVIISPDGYPNSQIFNCSLFLEKDKSLDEIIEDANRRHALSLEQNLLSKQMLEYWPAIFRFCLNVIIYATHNHLDSVVFDANPEAAKLWEKSSRMPESKKRKAFEAKAESLSQKRILLGSHISVDRSRDRKGGATGEGKSLAVRTLVSGHWRKQVCGKERAERRLTWIKPFWRGPEYAQAVARKHKLVITK